METAKLRGAVTVRFSPALARRTHLSLAWRGVATPALMSNESRVIRGPTSDASTFFAEVHESGSSVVMAALQLLQSVAP